LLELGGRRLGTGRGRTSSSEGDTYFSHGSAFYHLDMGVSKGYENTHQDEQPRKYARGLDGGNIHLTRRTLPRHRHIMSTHHATPIFIARHRTSLPWTHCQEIDRLGHITLSLTPNSTYVHHKHTSRSVTFSNTAHPWPLGHSPRRLDSA
jgi:hypothetical protein